MIARGLRVRSRSVTDLPRPVFLVSGDAKFLTVGGGAPACTITLTGDIAASFGGQPLDISWQTVSKTTEPSFQSQGFIAGGDAVPLWTGWRGVGYQASTFTPSDDVTVETSHGLYLFSSSFTEAVSVVFTDDRPGGTNGWMILTGGGPETFLAETNPFAKVGVRIDGATGDVEVVIDGVTYTKTDNAGLGALFSTDVIVAPLFTARGLSTTYTADVYTAAADLASFGLPAGTLDWCGNAIGEVSQITFLTVSE